MPVFFVPLYWPSAILMNPSSFTISVALLMFCFGPLVPFHIGFKPSYWSFPEEALT